MPDRRREQENGTMNAAESASLARSADSASPEQDAPCAVSAAPALQAPADRLDAAIAAGIRRGRLERRRHRRSSRYRAAAAVAAFLLVVASLLTIRISPAFATMLRDIPGLEKFVDLIESDNSVRLAAENDLMQPIGASDEHDGRTFTVQGIIVDDTRMVVFYELSGDKGEGPLRIDRPRFLLPDGQDLQGMYTYGDGEATEEGGRSVVRGKIDVGLQDGLQWPDEVVLAIGSASADRPDGEGDARNEPAPEAAVPGSPGDPGGSAAAASGSPAGLPEAADDNSDFRVRFSIDKARFKGMKTVYPIDRTVEVEGQRISFVQAAVTPLRVALTLEYADDNDKRIFDPGDIKLVDEKGDEWSSYTGEVGERRQVLYFESNYYNRPKELYVEGSWFRALDKDKTELVVNTRTKTIVKAPDDKVSLDSVTRGSDYTTLAFTLRGLKEDDKMLYSLIEGPFRDAEGRTREPYRSEGAMTRGSVHAGDWGVQSSSFYYLDNDDESYAQPLTFPIFNYPSYIRGPYRVRIW